MAYDPQDDGFHEIQLSGKQLVFLFMATTVVSIVIFLCGVLVGRGVPRETEASGMAADAEAQAGEPGSSGAGQRGATADTSIPSPAETQPTSEQGLSYPERLADPQPRAEQLEPRAEAKPAVPEKPAAKEPAPAAKPAPDPADARSSADADEKVASASEEAPSPSTPASLAESATEKSSKPAATKSAESGSGNWTVQVAALSKRDEAEAIAKRLQSKGYLAFLVGPSGGGAKMYRVRVGNYKDRAEAERVMRRLAQEERLKPWITR